MSSIRSLPLNFRANRIAPLHACVLLISAVIALFHEKFGRRPQPSDADAFAALAEGALAENGMPPDFLGGAEGAKRICAIALAEISPSCAILAGVIGQEVRV